MAAVPPGESVGLKSIETRKQRAKLGPLVICAGLQVDGDAWHRVKHNVPLWAWKQIEPQGVALCLVDIVEVRPLVPEDEPRAWFYEPGRLGLGHRADVGIHEAVQAAWDAS